MRLFLDANVVFSAAWSDDSRLRVFFDLADAGLCTLFSSAFALDEAERNIRSKRPQRLPSLQALSSCLPRVAEGVPAMQEWARAQGLPDKDTPILAAARQAGADVLVTGDVTHFGPLYGKSLEGLRVLSPAAALALLLDDAQAAGSD